MGEVPIVLRTDAVCKNFGSLEVARNVTIELPRGARHALIGPNGAGKTSLINLMTGELRPDSGRILLDGRDITGMAPAARVQNGLARTFQINTLFASLTPLEAVTLAVCERQGVAGQFWRSLTAHEGAIAEAHDLLVHRLAGLHHQDDRARRLDLGDQFAFLDEPFHVAGLREVDDGGGLTRYDRAALVAGGANALNQWWEKDADARMLRTRDRPLPAGRLRRPRRRQQRRRSRRPRSCAGWPQVMTRRPASRSARTAGTTTRRSRAAGWSRNGWWACPATSRSAPTNRGSR